MDHSQEHRASGCIVLIASETVLTAWSARPAPPGEVITVSDADTQAALDTIAHRRPRMVVLEEALAGTRRGEALVSRLQKDPAFHGVEVRLLSAERAAQISHLGAGIPLAAIAHPIQYEMIRRPVRVKVHGNLDASIDGIPTALVDLSIAGAQVLTRTIVHPSQSVQLLLDGSIRVGATVVWARFEMSPEAQEPQYRAGLQFLLAAPDALDALFRRVGPREEER